MVDNHSETVHPLPQVKRDGTLLLPRTFELLNPKNLHMKKSLLSLVLIGACGATMAQREVSSATRMEARDHAGLRTPTDTLFSAALADPDMSPTLYNSTGGGWVVGTNGYGDVAKAQAFLLDDAVSAEGIGVWFGGKTETSGDPTSSVTFKMYNTNGDGENSGGPITTGAPNENGVYASVDVLISDIDTATGAEFTYANFAPVYVADFFAAGVDFSGLSAGDSVGIVSTDEGYTEYQDFSWEMWNDNSWHTMLQAWPLDIDFFIFVVVDASSVGIDDAGTMNGMRMSFLNGNLVGQDVELAYTVDHNAKMRLIISDGAGRLVLDQDLGNRATGLYNQTISATNWNTGVYYVTLVADGQTLTKKIVKQ